MLLYHLSVLAHILSAMIWIGGMLFLALVLVPSTRHLPAPERAALFGSVGRRFRTIGWVCIATLLVTGVVNLTYRGVTWDTLLTSALWSSPFGQTLALKLGFVAILLGLSAYHDFVLGPRSVRLARSLPPGTTSDREPGRVERDRRDAERARRVASLIGRIEAILALVVLALASTLVRGTPFLH
jgi:putative copper export protein